MPPPPPLASALDSSTIEANLLETRAKQVFAIAGRREYTLSQIKADLKYTGDVDATVERIYNGKFLSGISEDPKKRKKKIEVILLSDDSPTKLVETGVSKKPMLGLELGLKLKKKKQELKTKEPKEWVSISSSDEESPGPLETIPKNKPAKKNTLASEEPNPLPKKPTPPVSKPGSSTTRTTFSTAKTGTSNISAKPSSAPSRFPSPPSPRPRRNPLAPPSSPYNPISFSSSPPVISAPTGGSGKKRKITHVSILSDGLSDLEDLPPPVVTRESVATTARKKPTHPPVGPVLRREISASTSALLAQLEEEPAEEEEGNKNYKKTSSNPRAPEKAAAASAPRRKTKSLSTSKDKDQEGEEEEGEIQMTEKPKKIPKTSETERVRKAEEKAAKAAEKEAIKAQKAKAKAEKEAEKKREQELVSVNKLRNSKKDCAPEMLVDISSNLAKTVVGEHLKSFLSIWGCGVHEDWNPSSLGGGSSWGGENIKLVKWRRRVQTEWSDERAIFIPIAEEIRDESHVLVYLPAKEFASLAVSPAGALDTHVNCLKSLFPSWKEVKPIYLIEGLTTFIRKSKNSKNRSFQGRVRAAMGEEETGSNSRARPRASAAAAAEPEFDEDKIEDALLLLQIKHNCLIHHTSVPVESAEWISIFTGDIGSIPYKTARMVLNTSFCTDVGQVKTGVDKEDTYIKMLQEIHRVTVSVANGINSEYSDVLSLVKGFQGKGPEAIADLPNVATRMGAPSNRNIGVATSRRIHKIFTGTDPLSTDV